MIFRISFFCSNKTVIIFCSHPFLGVFPAPRSVALDLSNLELLHLFVACASQSDTGCQELIWCIQDLQYEELNCIQAAMKAIRPFQAFMEAVIVFKQHEYQNMMCIQMFILE